MKKRLIGIITALIMCFSSFGAVQVLADGPELSYEQAEETCNRMIWYYDCGYYLETIAVADDLLQNYTVDEYHRGLAYDYKNWAQYDYDIYLQKSQQYTYKVPGWGMNVTYRGDMSVYMGDSDDYIEFEMPYWGAHMGLTSFYAGDWGFENPKQYVCDLMNVLDGSWYDSEYGENFEIISSNYVNVSGFNAYQAVFRHTSYTNRYWTEGEHIMGKILAFRYGDWIYVLYAQENEYNWSDDFWDAMETVINGISFS